MVRLGWVFFIAASMISYGNSAAAAKIFRWKCSYPNYTSPSGLRTDPDFNLEFVFDDATGKAVMIGNNGVTNLDVHLGSNAISFMEKLGTGAVQDTIISFTGSSVHSRHSIMIEDNKILPSQYYGRCLSD